MWSDRPQGQSEDDSFRDSESYLPMRRLHPGAQEALMSFAVRGLLRDQIVQPLVYTQQGGSTPRDSQLAKFSNVSTRNAISPVVERNGPSRPCLGYCEAKCTQGFGITTSTTPANLRIPRQRADTSLQKAALVCEPAQNGCRLYCRSTCALLNEHNGNGFSSS